MTDTTPYQLILKQQAVEPPGLQDLLLTLRDDYGLDMYTGRHRLIGPGVVQFGKGSGKKAATLATLLRQYGFTCWKIRRSPIACRPVRLRELERHQDHITFRCSHNQTIRLERGRPVVAVLADLSGQLPERHLRRHMVRKNYRGISRMAAMSLEQMCEIVLKGDPVLDLYLLGENRRPVEVIRIYAGRFSPEGLGERKTLSAVRNLDAVRRLVEEYAGEFRLHADFGLSRLPGCEIKTLDGQLEDRAQILRNLLRYGWLMCDLLQDAQAEPETASQSEDVGPVLLASALVTGSAGLVAAAAGDVHELRPGLENVSEELADALAEDQATAQNISAADPGLPPPPERTGRRILSAQRIAGQLGIVLIVGAMIAVTAGDDRWLRAVGGHARQELIVAAVSGALSLLLFWGGFHFIRLKRRIEDTPTSRVRSIAMGLVEVHGRARRKYALVSPMGQVACVYYRLRKYRRKRGNKWALVSDVDSSHVPFLVDDGTGSVTVDPLGATVRAKNRRVGAPGEVTMAFDGISADVDDEKWVEDVIYEETSLYVIGYAQPLSRREQTLGERVRQRLRDLKLDPGTLHRYDTDGDGRISETEWDAARGEAERQALSDHLAAQQGWQRQEDHAVIARPQQRSLPFVVAETLSEEALTRKYGWFSLPMLLGAVMAAGIALHQLMQFFE